MEETIMNFQKLCIKSFVFIPYIHTLPSFSSKIVAKVNRFEKHYNITESLATLNE